MPTYSYEVDGKSVPSVSRIVGLFGENKRPLIHVAWKLGREGKDYREVWGKEKNAGTGGHALCEALVKKQELPTLADYTEEERAGAQQRFEMFKSWLDQHSFRPVASEVPLVSKKWRFGGTIDVVGTINSKAALIDLKSKTLYRDQIIQVSAYEQLWNENHPDILIDSVHIFGMTGGFHHHMIPFDYRTAGWSAFYHLLGCHSWVEAIKV